MVYQECVNCGKQFDYLPKVCNTCFYDRFHPIIGEETVSPLEDHKSDNLHHCKNCGEPLDLSLVRTQCKSCHFPIEHTQLPKYEGGFNEATFKN